MKYPASTNRLRNCLLVAFTAVMLPALGSGADDTVQASPEGSPATVPAPVLSEPLPAPADNDAAWKLALARAEARRPIDRRAEGVVVFLGDGMGISTVTAARILEGQRAGHSGEENLLAWEGFPHTALVKTFNSNQQVPDSAGTATAMFAGKRTSAGVIGVDAETVRGLCPEEPGGHDIPSLFERAAQAGMATGIVTDTRITHATPAAAYAHTSERGWESDRWMPEEAVEAGCKDIARQLIEARLDVMFGGGLRGFLPERIPGPHGLEDGERRDGRNLIDRWMGAGPARRFVWSAAGLADLDPAIHAPVLGLFAASHLDYRYRRDTKAQPTLAAMTLKALDLLQVRGKPWLLLVEGGRIDHGHHEGRAAVALDETIAFSEAIAAALERLDLSKTLVVVTADHSHTMTISGYATRGNPILGIAVPNDAHGAATGAPKTAEDGMVYTTLAYTNGPGADAGPRRDPADEDTASPEYRQNATYALRFELAPGVEVVAETHGGEDVPLWAVGPRAHYFGGTIDQPFIFHVLARALELDQDPAD